jgi:hypothetical protein
VLGQLYGQGEAGVKSQQYAFLTQTYLPNQFISLYDIVDETLQQNWTALAAVPPPAPASNTTELPWSLGINAFHVLGVRIQRIATKTPKICTPLFSLKQQVNCGAMY